MAPTCFPWRHGKWQRTAGALIVDARTDLQFDDAHIPGAVCIPMLSAGFGSKLAWIADRDQKVVLVGRDDEDGRRAARLAVAVGISKLAGFLGGGMTSWRQEKREVGRIERLPIDELGGRLASSDLQVLDVRELAEWDAGHLPGSAFKPWHDIDGVPDGLDASRPTAVLCASGERAATGASLVRRYGVAEVIHVIDGGVPAWQRQGNPMEH